MTLAINGCFSPWIAVTTGFSAVNSSYNQENSHQGKKRLVIVVCLNDFCLTMDKSVETLYRN